jgi:hypothetical protein
MTITSQAPLGFDRSRQRRTLMHPFLGHRPMHRRGGVLVDEDGGRSHPVIYTTPPHNYRIRSLGGRDYRAWGIILGALAWTGFAAAHGAGLPRLTAVFAAADALTWGLAVGALVPTEDGLEYSTISVAVSASLLVLVGMFMVELRVTGAFFWVFFGLGALSLAIQMVSFAFQMASFRQSSPPPQPVPSLVDGRIVTESQ